MTDGKGDSLFRADKFSSAACAYEERAKSVSPHTTTSVRDVSSIGAGQVRLVLVATTQAPDRYSTVFPFSFSRCDHSLILISAAPSKMGRFSSPSVLQTFAAIASGEITTTTVWLQNHVQYIRLRDSPYPSMTRGKKQQRASEGELAGNMPRILEDTCETVPKP